MSEIEFVDGHKPDFPGDPPPPPLPPRRTLRRLLRSVRLRRLLDAPSQADYTNLVELLLSWVGFIAGVSFASVFCLLFCGPDGPDELVGLIAVMVGIVAKATIEAGCLRVGRWATPPQQWTQTEVQPPASVDPPKN